MCLIQSGYFTINGSSTPGPSCGAKTTNTVNVQCAALFGPSENGQQYKAELKINLPNGVDFSFYTPYKTVTGGQVATFTSENFVSPVPTGTYSTVWFVIYDIYGNTMCSGNGKGSGLCESLVVSSAPSPATVNVIIQNNIGGSVDAYRNDVFVASITTSQTVNYSIGDTFKFVAKPSSGYIFSKYCTDAGCSQSTTSNPFIGTITQSSGNLYTLFTSGGGGGGGGGGVTCDPVACPSDKNFCFSGQCIPKIYVLGGAVAIFALMMLRR